MRSSDIFFLLLIVRLLNRRPGGQLTLFEFVIVFLIGGLIILSTVGKDRSITNCATAILTVGLMHLLVSSIKSKFPVSAPLSMVLRLPCLRAESGSWRS